MLYRRSASYLVLVLCAGAFVACGRGSEPEVSRTDEGVLRLGSVQAADTVSRTVAPNGRLLVLEGLRGSLHLQGRPQSTAELSFVRRGRGDSPEDARSVLEGISITEQGASEEYAYTWTADDEDYASVDVRGYVPRDADLRIDRLGGPVRVEGLNGVLTVQHEHGSVDVRGAAGRVNVNIENGDIRVGFRSVPTEGPLHLETSNGDLRVALPRNASLQVDARTDVGALRTRDLPLETERFAPVNAGAQYDGQLGTGGPTLELRTQNGTITLLSADTTRTDTTALSFPQLEGPAPDTTVPAGRSDTILSDTAAVDTTSP